MNSSPEILFLSLSLSLFLFARTREEQVEKDESETSRVYEKRTAFYSGVRKRKNEKERATRAKQKTRVSFC